MLIQNENVPEEEIWADAQFSKVLNYLTEQRVYTNGTLRLAWLGAPHLALYTALIYEKDGGPVWILHTEEKTGLLKAPRSKNCREIFAAFAYLWGKEDDPISQKWAEALKNIVQDPELWRRIQIRACSPIDPAED